MNLFLKPKDAAPLIDATPETVRKWLREGKITHYIDNGGLGAGIQYRIDMTAEFGITREDWDAYRAARA